LIVKKKFVNKEVIKKWRQRGFSPKSLPDNSATRKVIKEVASIINVEMTEGR
jgi:hypothetical protein